MASINYATREINCKIVYYGAGMCGKTTNLQYIYAQTSPLVKGKMLSLATQTERTLFFDFLPLSIGEIRGFKVRFHLYSVPGQVFYDASRRIILQNADGIVFVVDSSPKRMEANLESFENLYVNMRELGMAGKPIPIILQYNKRDAPNAISVQQLENWFNAKGMPHFEAIAQRGVGVFDTLKAIGKQVLSVQRNVL